MWSMNERNRLESVLSEIYTRNNIPNPSTFVVTVDASAMMSGATLLTEREEW